MYRITKVEDIERAVGSKAVIEGSLIGEDGGFRIYAGGEAADTPLLVQLMSDDPLAQATRRCGAYLIGGYSDVICECQAIGVVECDTSGNYLVRRLEKLSIRVTRNFFEVDPAWVNLTGPYVLDEEGRPSNVTRSWE